MPFLDSTEPQIQDQPAPRFPEEIKPPAAAGDTFLGIGPEASRALLEESFTGRLGGKVARAFGPQPSDVPQPNYNPVEDIPQRHLRDGEQYLHLTNPAQVAAKNEELDHRDANASIIARTGGWGLAAGMAVGAVDPVNLLAMAVVPGAAATRAGNAFRWALTNAAVSGSQELLEGVMGYQKPPGEALLDVGASAVVGGLLGGIARRVPEATFNKLRTDLHRELSEGGTNVLGSERHSIMAQPLPSDFPLAKVKPGEEENIPTQLDIPGLQTDFTKEPLPSSEFLSPTGESTAGAQQVRETTLDEERIATGARFLTEGPLGKVYPMLQVLKSPSVVARRLAQELGNVPELTEKNLQLIKSVQPIERNLWGYMGDVYQAHVAGHDFYQQYLERLKGTEETPISKDQFVNLETARAMRNGDEHQIPEVAKYAAANRKIVIQDLFERAKKQGMMTEDHALFDKGYLTRQYNAPFIQANYNDWLKDLTNGFKAKGVENAEAASLAHRASDRILSGERNTMDWRIMEGIVPESGRMKGRTLPFPSEYLEKYLNNNIDQLNLSYVHSLAPHVEMMERFGSLDMKEQLDDVNSEFARLKEQAMARGADASKLESQRVKNIKDLTAMRDRNYGTFGMPKDPGWAPVRIGRFLRSANVPLNLGMALFSHVPDIPNAIMRYGTYNTFSTLAKVIGSSNLRAVALPEIRNAGAAVDMFLNITASSLGDYGMHSRYAEQRIMAKVSKGYTIGTGETPWITVIQGVTGIMAHHEILSIADKVAAGSRVPNYRLARLASAGLDADALKAISEQAAGKSVKVTGLRIGMTDTWENQKVAQMFNSAVLKDAHGVTLRPGIGDTPKTMSTELGKLLLQFQSFGFAANRMVLNPIAQGIAHGDMRSIQGLFALMGAGVLSIDIKRAINGEPPIDLSHPGKVAAEVLDKSNLLGWIGHYVGPSLYQMGETDAAGWQARNAANLLGPSVERGLEGYSHHIPGKLVAKEGEPGLNRSDLRFAIKMVPGSRTWYFRRLVDKMEDLVADHFNLPGKSNAQLREESERKETVQ